MDVLENSTPTGLQERLIRRAWQDEQFAERLRTAPRLAIAEETGVKISSDIRIEVHQETASTAHLVVPTKPQGIPSGWLGSVIGFSTKSFSDCHTHTGFPHACDDGCFG